MHCFFPREKITFAVLKLREDGDLQKLRTRWWYDSSECKNVEKTKVQTILGLHAFKLHIYVFKTSQDEIRMKMKRQHIAHERKKH